MAWHARQACVHCHCLKNAWDRPATPHDLNEANRMQVQAGGERDHAESLWAGSLPSCSSFLPPAQASTECREGAAIKERRGEGNAFSFSPGMPVFFR